MMTAQSSLVYKPIGVTVSPLKRAYVFTLIAISFALLFFYRSQLDHISILRNVSPTPAFKTALKYPHSPITTTPSDLPPLLSTVLPPHVGPVYDFSVPHLVTYYEDELPNSHTRLYLVTAGIMMDHSKRNFSAAGCLVGSDVYPSTLFVGEVITCIISRRLRPGEKVAPVLLYDHELKRAEAGPIELPTGIIAELYPGDISELPDNVLLHGNLSSSDLSDFRLARSSHRVVSSDHFVREKAKLRPRYQLCQMTMVAPNSFMIKDWANYHRRIGVDKVFIFDNGAALDLKKMFEGRPDIEVVDWPYHKSQSPVVSAFLFMSRARCERVLMHDSDEYMMFGLGNGTCLTTGERPMIRYAKKIWKTGAKGYQHPMVLYLIMTNSGFLRRPKGEVPMNYIHRRDSQDFRNGKTMCYTDAAEWEAGSIHHCGLQNGHFTPVHKESIKHWGDVLMEPVELDDTPFLLHFRYRSWEDWIEKWDAGRVSGKQVADQKAGTFKMDEPMPRFMEVRPELEYKHFRDKIYKRVMKEGRMDEQIIVQTKNGRRCEMLYRIVNDRVTGPVREKCS